MSSPDPNSSLDQTQGLVDFHCHLDLYPDLESAIAECEQRGIYTLAVTTTPRAWTRNNELASKTKYVRPALGLHPQLVAERSEEIGLWESLLPEARYVGEIGLDAGPRFYKSYPLQVEIFGRILSACADAGGRILSVHSVRSAGRVIDMLTSHFPPNRGRAVLHWFTGNASEARRAVQAGCYFSINRAMLDRPASRRMVASIPPERLLTETDGPFTVFDDRPSKPSDVSTTVSELADALGIPPSEVRDLVAHNLRQLLKDAGG
ncbi:MAG: TatD family hydrolase [Acidobacteria bacterium]|nr:TatD family hydrolase [Acidobacteriota bacterium]